MNICVIGNSHIGALKLGWRELEAAWPDVRVDFFGALTWGLLDTRAEAGGIVSDNALVSEQFCTTSGGRTGIVVGGYDRVVLCGVDFGVNEIVKKLYRHFRSDRHAQGKYVLSPAAFHAAALGVLALAPGAHLRRLLRDLGCPDPAVCSQPRISEAVLDHEANGAAWRDAVGSPDLAELVAIHDEYLDGLSRDGARVVRQPERTLAPSLLTRSEYARDGVGLLADQSYLETASDFTHMNAAYGALVLSDILSDCGRSRA